MGGPSSRIRAWKWTRPLRWNSATFANWTKWLTRGLIRAANDGTSGDAINGLHINLAEYHVVLTDEEQHLWRRLSHHHTDQ
ncbi:hypothetical protein GCM10022236_14910 [Microlunatus ginsengisoli]|uniref:Uncharacterized protein n=1 Tax=Microlunatus ginsengisoli TaxID=363863 RepID=A0ABP6ZN80_9ACTN